MTITTELQGLIASMLEPTPLAIIVTIILVVTLPIFLHLVVFRSSSSTTLPTILLIGPPGSGKTSLLTLVNPLFHFSFPNTPKASEADRMSEQFETGETKTTRTSQTPLSVECSLPITTAAASSQYRSKNDPSNQIHKKFLLADTPGHGKLRRHAISAITSNASQNLRGVIFMVDSADLSPDSESLRQTAEYLHDVLLLLQKRVEKTEKKMRGTRVLVAANKADLFTALPAPLVKAALEAEITSVRSSLNKGLLDSGVDADVAQERGWLGEAGDSPFRFEQVVDAGTIVSVKGGNVTGGEKADIGEWWGWVGGCL